MVKGQLFQVKSICLKKTYGLFVQDYKVALFSNTLYPTIQGIIIPGLKSTGQF